MVKKTKKRRMITISKELDKLINMRGGNKYIIHCLYQQIMNKEMPNYYEIEQSTGQDVYERLALHKGKNEWYDKLFPEGDPNDKSKK